MECNHYKVIGTDGQYYCNLCDVNHFHNVLCVHDIYKPKFFDDNEESKKQIIYVLKELLNLIDISPTPNQLLFAGNNIQKSKTYYAYLIYDWLSKNLWFIENHENFRRTVQMKLAEFRQQPILAKEILDDFGWIETINPPFRNITSRGRVRRRPNYYK